METEDSRRYQSGSNGNNKVTDGSSSLFYFIIYLLKKVMTLTRKERESLVIDLLNKYTPIRKIAKQAGLSFRDIGAIKKKAEEEKEAKQGQAQQIFASTQ